MKTETMKLSDLKPADYNPRRISDAAMSGLKASLDRWGLVQPIIYNETTGNVVGGHQRLKALTEQGATEADVVVVAMDEVEEKALNVALNSPAISGEFTDDLDALLDEVRDEMPDLFDALLLDELRGTGTEDDDGEDPPDEDPDGDLEPPEDPDSEPGKVYELGPHRLICGDCTDGDVVATVIGDRPVDILMTDPPYGISVVTKDGAVAGTTREMAAPGVYVPVEGDDEIPDVSMLFGMAPVVVLFGANYFPDQLPHRGRWFVWDKGRPEGEQRFSDAELVWTSLPGVKVNTYRVVWHGMIREGESGKRVHPTQKPIKLIGLMLDDMCKEGAVVLDTFAGSGSTLIAASKTGRVARCVELSPAYCDVIRRRWTAYAEKLGVDPGPGALEP